MAFFTRNSGRRLKIKKESARLPLLPAAVHGVIARRMTDTAGAGFVVLGLTLAGALASFNAADPSLNTAVSGTAVHNWLGRGGAYAADILLQTLGLAAWLFVFAFLGWGWRILARRPLPRLGGKITQLVIAVLAAAVALARVPAFASWGLGAYFGGSAGALLFRALSNPLQGWLGGAAFIYITAAAACVSIVSALLALGFSLDEWAAGLGRARLRLASSVSSVSGIAARLAAWHARHASGIAAVSRRRTRVRIDTDAAPEADTAPERAADETLAAPRRKPVVDMTAEKKQKAAPRDDRQKKLALARDDEWLLPALDLLDDHAQAGGVKMDAGALQKNAEMLQSTLHDFGVEGEILKVSPGPIVTLYEMEPAPGTKTSRVIGLADDIARSMSAVSVRVAVVPGKNAIGMELPNARRETVYFKEMVAAGEYDRTQAKLPLALGKNIAGDSVIADLAKMPHLLVAGTTGSGKSVAINTMILSLLYKLSPEQCRFIMIDPKMLELSVYDDIPHLLTPVVTEPHRAVTALKWAVREMEDRYRAMSKLGVRNIDGYNTRLKEARTRGEVLMHKVQTGFDADTGKPVYEEQPISQAELPYIVIIVDEFADLMLVAGKEVENAIQRLAQMARAAGIHLIMATQRPSVDVITGVIKANFPTRISFQVTSRIDSRTIIGDHGAEQLLGQGDMLYMAAGNRVTRVHGPFVSDDEVEKIVTFLRQQGTPDYIDGVTESEEDFAAAAGGGASGDDTYDQAVAVVLRDRKVSTSYIQRQLNIGYNRAANIIDRMEKEGLISSANHVGKREILVENYGT